MNIFEKVALEHGATPAEVRAEIEGAIALTGMKISAEDLINVLAGSIMAQMERERSQGGRLAGGDFPGVAPAAGENTTACPFTQ